MATAVHPSTNVRPLDPSRVSAARPWDQIQVNHSTLPRHGGAQPLGRRGSQTFTQIQIQSPHVPFRLTAVERHMPAAQVTGNQSPQQPQAEVVHTTRSHYLSPPLPPRSPTLPSRSVTKERPVSVTAPVASSRPAPTRGRSPPPEASTAASRQVASNGLKAWAKTEQPALHATQSQPLRGVRQAGTVKPRVDAGSFSIPNPPAGVSQAKKSELTPADLKLPSGAVPSTKVPMRNGLPLRNQVRRHSTVAAFPLAAASPIEVPFARVPEVEAQASKPTPTDLELGDGNDLIQSTFPGFAPLLEASRDYARLSGCRFLGHDFRAELQGGNSEDEMPMSRTLSEDIGNSPMARWKARATAAPVVKDFAARLQENSDPQLAAEIALAFHLIMRESTRNVMVGKCRELDMFPPVPSPAEVESADCEYEDMSAPLEVVAQRLYNDEVQRRDPALQKVGKALIRRKAMLASFLVDFASEAGWQSPDMPEPHARMMQDFARKVGDYERGRQENHGMLADEWDFLGLDVLAPWRPAGRKLRDLAAKLERSFSRSPDARHATACHRKAGMNRYRRSRSFGQQVRFETDEEDAVDLREKPTAARRPMAAVN